MNLWKFVALVPVTVLMVYYLRVCVQACQWYANRWQERLVWGLAAVAGWFVFAWAVYGFFIH